jgi:hypothetical protein
MYRLRYLMLCCTAQSKQHAMQAAQHNQEKTVEQMAPTPTYNTAKQQKRT